MAIRVRPPGSAETIAGLAKLAGEGIAAQRVAEQADRQAIELRRIKAQKEIAEMGRQWDKEELILQHQWDVELRNRSNEWNIQKMELASKLDFEREEKRRQQELDEKDAKKKAIRDSNILTDAEKEKWLLEVETEIPVVSRTISSRQQSPVAAAMAKLLGKETGELTAPTTGREIGGGYEKMGETEKSLAIAQDALQAMAIGERTEELPAQIAQQKQVLNQRLIDDVNTKAGFEKLVTETGETQFFPTTPYGPAVPIPKTVEEWPEEALNSYDLIKMRSLTPEEIGTFLGILASGDRKLLLQWVQRIKQISVIPKE